MESTFQVGEVGNAVDFSIPATCATCAHVAPRNGPHAAGVVDGPPRHISVIETSKRDACACPQRYDYITITATARVILLLL